MDLKSFIKSVITLFLVSIFLIQSFSGFAYLQTRSDQSDFISFRSNVFEFIVQSFYTPIKHSTRNHAWNLEAEYQLAEEDDIQENDGESPNDEFEQSRIAKELFYNASLNIQFLKLKESRNRHVILPLFVLHHNWKSFIC